MHNFEKGDFKFLFFIWIFWNFIIVKKLKYLYKFLKSQFLKNLYRNNIFGYKTFYILIRMIYVPSKYFSCKHKIRVEIVCYALLNIEIQYMCPISFHHELVMFNFIFISFNFFSSNLFELEFHLEDNCVKIDKE